MTERKKAICPICGKPQHITKRLANGGTRKYDPVDVVADLINARGCSMCWTQGRRAELGL